MLLLGFRAAISVPEGSENVAEKMFFGNAKRERCDAKTNALVRWSVARDDEARARVANVEVTPRASKS
ncbi:MAG: hypothetical protein ACKOJB_06250, partial [Chthoniobacterales bacterium]